MLLTRKEQAAVAAADSLEDASEGSHFSWELREPRRAPAAVRAAGAASKAASSRVAARLGALAAARAALSAEKPPKKQGEGPSSSWALGARSRKAIAPATPRITVVDRCLAGCWS